MSRLDQFIERAKAYVVLDVEEKALKEKFKEVIMSPMLKVRDGLNQVDGYDCKMNIGDTYSDLKIHDKLVVFMIDSVKNHIVVYEDTNIIDEIILKEENLFSTKREEVFTEDTLVDYLNETFQGIIG
ncbi:DUF3942 family protein [Bacillus toyonensis]|uniref:DUF3942 family protein n=1 Tax=Bacillus toyonensis TaxID=155322 RepID=UPI000BF9A4D5|nr:DUF3942 family protein [Bacillus toyonensis]PGB05373.1 hypothetical protein COL96_28410 [Bacillus toyonensis]